MSTAHMTAKMKLIIQGQDKIKKMLRDINQTQQAVRQAGDQAGYFSRKIVQALSLIHI